MKPINSNLTVVDNMPGEEVEFTINQSAAHLIMQSMSDLYSNRARAVIREYSTNAYDSHVEAGIPNEPIDVTLPSELHPFFEVVDHGVGMDSRTLKEVYTSFGDSTRRDSDSYTGYLGYGCKSALAYTNTFTVTAVKDGKKTVGIITRKDNGVMVLKEVLNVDTIEGNGVTVQIPVSPPNQAEFNKEAREFYSFWPQGRVHINGTEVENPYTKDDRKLTKNLWMMTGNDSYVVMGNVPYKINNPASLYPRNEAYKPFVVYVQNGAVEFTPSREELKYSEHTRNALQGFVDEYIADVRKQAEKEVKGAKTHWEALKASRKWWNVLGIKLQYKGKDIPTNIDFTGDVWHTYRSWHPVERVNADGIDLDLDVLVIVEATQTVSSYHRQRIRQWQNTGKSPFQHLPRYVYFTQDPAWKSKWVNPKHVISWETIKEQTPPPTKNGGTKIAGSFDLLKPDGTILRNQVVTKAPKLWIDTWWASKKTIAQRKQMFDTFNVTTDVVIVPANRVGKYTRENKVQNLRDFVQTQVDLDGDAMYNSDQRAYFSIDHWAKQKLLLIDPARIDDPDIRRLAEVARRTDIQQPAEYEINKVKARVLNLPFKPFNSNKLGLDTIINERYPLMGDYYFNWNQGKMEHIYVYINACVQARKDGRLV